MPGFAAPDRVRRSFAPLAAGAALLACPILPSFAAPSPEAAIRLSIEGVGGGTFADARLAANPGSGAEQPDPLCLTLEGGTPDDPPALLEWMRSSLSVEDDGVTSTRLPDATLTVLSDHDGMEPGVYRLSDISVRQYRLDARSGSSDPRLEAVEISCGAIESGPKSG